MAGSEAPKKTGVVYSVRRINAPKNELDPFSIEALGEASATSPKEAIKKITDEGGNFEVIPVRYITHMKRKVEMKPVDEFE